MLIAQSQRGREVMQTIRATLIRAWDLIGPVRVSSEGIGLWHHASHFDDGLLLFGLFTGQPACGTEAGDDLCREFLVRGI